MRRTLIVLGFVVGLVAACSGSSVTGGPQASGAQAGASQDAATPAALGTATTPAGTPKQLDACSLVTAAEAAAVLGKPVDAGSAPVSGAHSCVFPESAKAADAVEISITTGSKFDPTQKSIPGLTITQVSGIGDAAYYVDGGVGFLVLNVRKGQITFSTSVLLKGASAETVMAGEKALALAVLGRI